MNKGGEVQWLKEASFDTSGKGGDVILYSQFSPSGDLLKSDVYPFDPNYADYGIKFDALGNVYYSASFANTLGLKIDKITLGLDANFDAVTILKDETDKHLSQLQPGYCRIVRRHQPDAPE